MSKHLSNAIYRILKSLVGLLFRNGIAFGEFSILAKRAYIEVTEKELLASGQKATTSMISISTGLTRKDVSALRKNLSPKIVSVTQQNRAIRVISAWVSDPRFCKKDGKAKQLVIQGKRGTFEQLVNLYSGDMPYRAMLKELLRIEAIEIKDKDSVVLVRAAYIPSGDDNAKYDFLGEDVSLLISTIKHNIIEADNLWYQRKVSYSNVPEECLDEFKTFANKENQRLLIKLNAWLVEHDMGKQTIKNPMKVGVGVYYFEEPKDA